MKGRNASYIHSEQDQRRPPRKCELSTSQWLNHKSNNLISDNNEAMTINQLSSRSMNIYSKSVFIASFLTL